MNLTLREYADLIISNVYGGLKGVTNFSLSKEAVAEEFILSSRRFIPELQAAQRFEPEEFYQIIPKLKLTPLSDLSEVPIPDNPNPSKGKVMSVEIPEMMWIKGLDPIDYIGPFNRHYQYIVKKGDSFINQSYSRFHSKEPSAWVKGDRLYVVNNLKGVTHIQIRAIFKDPSVLLGPNDPFPISKDVADMVIGKLVEGYVRRFAMKNPQPNTQNEFVNLPQEQ